MTKNYTEEMNRRIVDEICKESSHDQNVYEYHRVKIIEMAKPYQDYTSLNFKQLKNKIDELTIEQNHLMKDFELYKKAFKQYVRDNK